jgi:DNA-binding SARP family transcriptional activator
VEFRLLGPLEVFRDGVRLPLGGAKQQTLLAYLLLHANEHIGITGLIAALWAASQPSAAVKNLQLYVSRLRRLLETPGSAPRLTTHGRGYSLTVHEDELDLSRCHQLIRRGGLAQAEGAHREAEKFLWEALGLWRGEPLTSLAETDAMLVEAERLNVLRISLYEDYFAIRIETGGGPDIVPELLRLVALHPYRERLRGQLMHALCAAGARSTALDVYRQGYRLLVDDIGIEPGRDLQRLHDDVLADRLLSTPVVSRI